MIFSVKRSYVSMLYVFHFPGHGDPYLRDIGEDGVYHIVDDVYGYNDCNNYSLAEQALGPHVAPLGMRFYHNHFNQDNYMFPNKYYNSIFVAEHGSWNRDISIGVRVVVVVLGCDKEDDDYSRVIGHEIFLDGFILNENTNLYAGRPVDIEILYDGSIIISDDESHNIYRIIYDKTLDDTTRRTEDICGVPTPQPTDRSAANDAQGFIRGYKIGVFIMVLTGYRCF